MKGTRVVKIFSRRATLEAIKTKLNHINFYAFTDRYQTFCVFLLFFFLLQTLTFFCYIFFPLSDPELNRFFFMLRPGSSFNYLCFLLLISFILTCSTFFLYTFGVAGEPH